MASAHPQSDQRLASRQQAVLEQTYPDYRISGSPGGMWSAVRETPPTTAQAAGGVHRYIVQPDAEALYVVLAQQVNLASRNAA